MPRLQLRMDTPPPGDISLLEAQLAAHPRDAALWRAHGEMLWRARRVGEALASFEAAIALDTNDARAYVGRGDALTAAGRTEEAIASYDAAIAQNPSAGGTWRGRGLAWRALGDFGAARADLDQAVMIDPGDSAALYERAQLRGLVGRDFAGAATDLERLLEIDADVAYGRGDLVHARMQTGDWRSVETLIAEVHAGVRAGLPVATPFVYQALSSSPADLQACAAQYAARHFPPGPRACGPRVRDTGKIRVGYVAGEFHAHATAFLTAGLFEQHDKSRFEIIALDNGVNDASAMRQRLEAAFDQIIEIAPLSDAAAADRIAAAGIDILVNLNGYFGRGRMGVFARRAAPVQVNYLGFPGTLGAEYIDYIVADGIVIPPEEERFYSEQVVTLPHCYQANDDKLAMAKVAQRDAHGLPAGAVVLANFNQAYKITPDMFAAWMRILRAVDKAVMWLWASHPDVTANLRRAAREQGVAPERLIFAGDAGHEAHLARLALADLYLDTSPYNAHTGASDALWAGVPLITCKGNAFAGRVAASLLAAVGMAEDLVTEDMAAYEARVVRLARDEGLRRTLRTALAERKTREPLFDSRRFARGIEAAYTTMFEINRRGEVPRGFSVSS